MFDLKGANINRDFNTALQRRPQYKEISCDSTGLSLLDQFQFDQTENISSIVTDVRELS